jgi:hypothetical protein
MRVLFGAVLFLVIFVFLQLEAAYRDISRDSPYREKIGQVCKLKVPMRAHGVAKKLEQHKSTDYVTVWEPGFTGPEVTFVESIQPGTVFRVLEARKCWNCPFDDLTDYRVNVEPAPAAFAGHPVCVRAEMMSEQYVDCKAAQCA